MYLLVSGDPPDAVDQLPFLLKRLNLEHRRKHLLRTRLLKFGGKKCHTGLQFCEIQPYLLLLAGGSKIIAENVLLKSRKMTPGTKWNPVYGNANILGLIFLIFF